MPAKASRASYKGQLRQVKNLVAEFKKNPSSLKDPKIKVELEIQKETIERIERKYLEVQSQILQEAPAEQKENEEREMETFLADCQDTHAAVARLLLTATELFAATQPSNSTANSEMTKLIELLSRQLDESQKQREADQEKLNILLTHQRDEWKSFLETSNVASSTIINQTVTPSVAKLDSLKVPEFHGNYLEWKSYQNLFISLVDKNQNLTKSQKMVFLKNSLKGEALLTISHLMVDDANYESAWKMVQDRYDDTLKIVNTHIEAFINQPSMSTPNASNLRNLYATSVSTIQALEGLKVSGRDPWLIYIIRSKMDAESQVLWSREVGDDVPTWDQFQEFLKKRCKSQELCPSSSVQKPNSHSENSKSSLKKSKAEKSNASALVASNSQDLCQHCKKGHHGLFRCKDFLSLSPQKRLEAANRLKMCHNCLADTHNLASCSYPPCRSCSVKHNRLLHDALHSESKEEKDPSPIPTSSKGSQTQSSLSCIEDGRGYPTRVLLATARVRILDKQSNVHYCRALLDAGSQVNLITTNLCQMLALSTSPSDCVVQGIGISSHTPRHQVSVRLQFDSTSGTDVIPLDCLVMRKITSDQPSQSLDRQSFAIPENFRLADPDWNTSQRVDLLIGGQLFWHLLLDETHTISPGAPLLKSSVFGWLVVGPYTCTEDKPSRVTCNITTLASIDSTLRKFWEIEDIPQVSDSSKEHQEVEKYFTETTTRNSDGRYMVRLPRNDNFQHLGNNRFSAVRQLAYLERRLNKNEALLQEYSKVFEEYLQLNIIEPVPRDEFDVPSFYLPHHCVVKEQSTTTKVRIVFNASAKSHSGLSLNDCLKVGPVVQPSLVTILWRFRLHKFAITCDITKMYLQILLHPDDRDFQRFVWRSSASEAIQDYRFRTVCFGVAPSPFLATRALLQLAEDEGEKYPLAAAAIQSNFYVDDCLASVPDQDTLIELKKQLIQIMECGCIQLAKFKTNCKDLMEDTSGEHDLLDLSDHVVKTLGMFWNPYLDTFQFKVAVAEQVSDITKRMMLSVLARIFDPIGIISPLVTNAKLLLQEAWKCTKNWDDPVPPQLKIRWLAYLEDLRLIESLRIPRWVSDIESSVSSELHVFSDASALAYGAAVFLVHENGMGRRSSRLLTSKTKIMPLAGENSPPVELTIPKAELCGALMAANLMGVVSKALGISNCFYWTDATIVLYQLHSPSEKREMFVRRRVHEILKTSKAEDWRHVPTKDNPADLLSRGATSEQLIKSDLWWFGPGWLLDSLDKWPPSFDTLCLQPVRDRIPTAFVHVAVQTDDFISIYQHLMTRISKWRLMQRSLAYVLRAVSIFKKDSPMVSPELNGGLLSVKELRDAETLLVKWDQEEHLGHLFAAVDSGTINTDHKLKKLRQLRPFVDQDGVMRVGGRLSNSPEPFDVRHPRLLPKGVLADLIARQFHADLLHPGPLALLARLRQKFWPLGARDLTRKIFRSCIKCMKANPPTQEQLMGDLPEQRVTHLRPFKATGVDFAGPMLLKTGVRKGTTTKAYVAVFVCMSTKALHLELVSSLSTQAFIATLRRFVARRGVPSHIFSDNGTTFVGADRELKDLLTSTVAQEEFSTFLSTLEVTWCFQPPRAPHHGGLWEAAVRSCKHHLKRVLGQTPLTYEEMTTVLHQVEAVLNSRPITPISPAVDDPPYITPGHFLIGAPPTQLPDPELLHLPINRLDRWQLCQKLSQDLTKRWKQDYLHSLQIRSKWSKEEPNLKINDVVLFKEDLLPSTQWPLGVVVDVFPGRDGKTRVVNVRTTKGIFKRPITKVVLLPINSIK